MEDLYCQPLASTGAQTDNLGQPLTSVRGHTGTYTQGKGSSSVTHLKVLKVFDQIMTLAQGQSLLLGRFQCQERRPWLPHSCSTLCFPLLYVYTNISLALGLYLLGKCSNTDLLLQLSKHRFIYAPPLNKHSNYAGTFFSFQYVAKTGLKLMHTSDSPASWHWSSQYHMHTPLWLLNLFLQCSILQLLPIGKVLITIISLNGFNLTFLINR